MSGRAGVLDPAPLLELFPRLSDGEIAKRLGVNRRTVQRWKHDGHRLFHIAADRYAIAAGFHPCEL